MLVIALAAWTAPAASGLLIKATVDYTNVDPSPATRHGEQSAGAGYVSAGFTQPNDPIVADVTADMDEVGLGSGSVLLVPGAISSGANDQSAFVSSIYENNYTNDDIVPHAYRVKFRLESGATLALIGPAGANNRYESELTLRVRLNGGSVFTTSALLAGTESNFTISSPVLPTQFQPSPQGPSYGVGPYAANVQIGPFAPGESFTVRVEVVARTAYDRGANGSPGPTAGSIGSSYLVTDVRVELAVGGCSGIQADVNGDSLVNGRDVSAFVACVQTGGTATGGCLCADMNGGGTVTAADIVDFVAALLP
jgi:hypothetical protein